jgi:hypothetical protein
VNVLFCTAPQGPPENTGYDHGVVALAEGLEALNAAGAQHRWSGTVPYWRRPGPTEWLVPNDGAVHWGNADVVVVSYLLWGDHLTHPAELDHLPPTTKLVFLDAMDGWRTFFLRPELRRFDVVLRTHLNRRYPRPANVKPWAFGLSNRLIDATAEPAPWADRRQQILFNFRVGHPLRDWARRTVVPALAGRFPANSETDVPPGPEDPHYGDWAQSGRRHHPTYFARLGTTAVGAAYGGYFGPGLPLSLNSPVLRALYKVIQLTKVSTRTIVQFDSWRLWETFAAGALVVHVDLGRYGADLPEMPVNRVHYWAISPDTADRDLADLLAASNETLGAIADAGRRWALEFYSPGAQARRLLSYLNVQE